MNLKYMHPADVLVYFMNRVYSNGLTTTSGGNFSVKDEEGNIWITPSGIDKGTLTRLDIVCVKPDGTIVGKHKPSMELPFHKRVYQVCPTSHAVLHAHPPALVSISLLRKKPELHLLPTFFEIVKKLDTSLYDIPGSISLGEKIAKVFSAGVDAVMMDNHGIVVTAPTMLEAFKKFEAMENAASIVMQHQTLGAAKLLTDAQVKAFAQISSKIKQGDCADTSSKEADMRNDMVQFTKRAYHHGLFSCTQGVYASRINDKQFLVSPDSVDRLHLHAQDIVKVEQGICERGKEVSRYSDIFAKVFANNKQIGAVSVSQPNCTMAFAVTGAELDSKTIPESYIMMRSVVRLGYDEFIKNPTKVADLLDVKSPIVLVENGLLFAAGVNMTKCFDSMEVCDFTAKTLLYALRMKALGNIKAISAQEVDELNKEFHLL